MGLRWSDLYRLHRAAGLAGQALDAVRLPGWEGLLLRLRVTRGIPPLPELDGADREAYPLSLADIPVDGYIRADDAELLGRFNRSPDGQSLLMVYDLPLLLKIRVDGHQRNTKLSCGALGY